MSDKNVKQIDSYDDPTIDDILYLSVSIEKLQQQLNALIASRKLTIGNRFIEKGKQKKDIPDQIQVNGTMGTVFFQLKRRSSNSVLNEEELAICQKAKIPLQEVYIKQETYYVNPAYMDEFHIVDKFIKQTRKIPGIPEDFLIKQDAEKKIIPSEKALEYLFSIKPRNFNILFSILSVIAIFPRANVIAPKKITAKLGQWFK